MMRIRIKEKLRIRKIMCVTLKGYGFCKTDKIVILCVNFFSGKIGSKTFIP